MKEVPESVFFGMEKRYTSWAALEKRERRILLYRMVTCTYINPNTRETIDECRVLDGLFFS